MGPSDHFTRMWTMCGHCKLFGTYCILGRAPRTKKTLPDFYELCQVTRHPQIFRGLMGCQRDTQGMGRHNPHAKEFEIIVFISHKKKVLLGKSYLNY